MKESTKASARLAGPSRADLDARQAVDAELIDRIRSGDQRSVTILLQRYRWLSQYRARGYYLSGSTEQDVAQEAMIGLFKAIRDFDGASQTPFAAFADLCIKRQIASAVKTANRHKHVPLNSALSLDLANVGDDASDRTFADILAGPSTWDPSVLIISAEQIENVRKHLTQTLTELEADVLELSLQGLSYERMAEILDSHRKTIDNALQRIRAKLKAHLAEEQAS